MLLVLLLIRTGLRSKGPGPQSPQEVGCVARVCVLQGIGRAGGGQGHAGSEDKLWGEYFKTSVLTHVYTIYIQLRCLEQYCFRAVLFQR